MNRLLAYLAVALAAISRDSAAESLARPPATPGLEFAPLIDGHLLQMLLGLAIVLLLIIGLSWLVRRTGALGTQGNAIKVIGSMALSTRERLILIEVDQVRLLIGIAPGHLHTLHVFDTQAEASFDQALSVMQEVAEHG